MHRVMQALRALDYHGCVIWDHIPQMVGGPGPGLAYSIADMRALVQAVDNEAADGQSTLAAPMFTLYDSGIPAS